MEKANVNDLPLDHVDDVQHVVYVRLPFPRGDFVDPPLVREVTRYEVEGSDV